MELEALLLMLAGQYPWLMLVLAGLGSLVVIAQAIVTLTPSKKDDEALEGLISSGVGSVIYKALTAFAPIKKK